jgi:hypothetical protein
MYQPAARTGSSRCICILHSCMGPWGHWQRARRCISSCCALRAGLRNRYPQRYTCMGVPCAGDIRFLGSVFATGCLIRSTQRLLCLSRTTRAAVLITATVRGTARRTSSCIDLVQLHRTYTRVVSCEWSH